jgi:hypothetical protein
LQDQLRPLVKLALEDRALRQPAFTAGLDEEQLLSHLIENPPRLTSVGMDERAEIEAAKSTARDAAQAIAAWERRSRFYRRVAIGLMVEVGVAIAIFIPLLEIEAAWLWLVIGTFAVGWVLFGAVTLANWPPFFLRSRISNTEYTRREAEDEVAAARKRLDGVLVEAEIKPALRTYLNSRAPDEYRTTLTLVEQEGLAELEDPRYAIPTRAREELDRFLDDMPGGSIGLSGPRGVGKTTLIKSVCPTIAGGTHDRLGVVVAAPVKFDSREFLLHLFAEVCRAVVGPGAVDQLREPDPVTRAIYKPGSEALFLFGALIAPVIGALVILNIFIPWKPLPQAVIGTVMIIGGLFALRVNSQRRFRSVLQADRQGLFPFSFRRNVADDQLQMAAVKRLEDIWYQQTFTSGWSGSLNAGVAEAGLEGGREISRNQMTLPDIVAEFRRLLSLIAEKRRVLIGVDELDKLDSREDAYTFMNEMKVLFGLDGCFFLISVSEDAMSVFERRGLPFRDVFDSSFDDVINVGFLCVDESVDLLQRRVIGMPLPFIFLCHCIAGGLARDVIRVAREVVVSNPAGGSGWPLHKACRRVLEADIRAKVAASLIASRRMTAGPDVDRLRTWLQRLHTTEIEAQALFDVCDNEGRVLIARMETGETGAGETKNSPRLMAAELLTFLLYAATLLEFFKASNSPDHYRDAKESGRIEQLALARQAMAIHPRTAWETLREFRGENETTLGFPATAA